MWQSGRKEHGGEVRPPGRSRAATGRSTLMLQRIRAREDWADKNVVQKGFTLVELLVVVSILGILAAVVVFSVSGINNTSQNSACKTDASEIRTAVEAYRAQNTPTAQPTMTQLVSAN